MRRGRNEGGREEAFYEIRKEIRDGAREGRH